jgi:type I restriction enzyme S subunit
MTFPADWEIAPLQECLSAIIDYRGKTPNKTSAGIPLITAKIVKNGRIEAPNEFIAEEDYDIWMTRGLPEPGDVVITTEAPLGEVAQLGGDRVALAQRIILLRGDRRRLDNTYLKYCLSANYVQSQLHGRASGTTVTGIKQSELRKIEIALPPLAEQRNIAVVLRSLDDKIEHNHQMNATLEAMAHALFKSWFVDFDPVKAKAAGRAPEGIDADAASLFPSEFEESELGPIPKGWEMLSLGELVDVKHGYAFKSEYFRDEPPGDILLTPGNFEIGGGFKADKFKYYDGFCPDDFVLEVKDLLVTMTDLSKASDTLGYPALVPTALSNSRYLHNQRLGKIIINSPERVSKMHLYYLLRSESYRKEVLASMTGTTVKHTSPARIKAFRFAFPKDNLSLRFGEYADALYDNQSANNEQSFTLANIRNVLLPRLISGQLRIPDIEQVEGGL